MDLNFFTEKATAALKELAPAFEHRILVKTLRGVVRVNLSALVTEDPSNAVQYKIALDALKDR